MMDHFHFDIYFKFIIQFKEERKALSHNTMYVNQATVCVFESFIIRANNCVRIKRSSRKSPYSHTFVRYGAMLFIGIFTHNCSLSVFKHIKRSA